MNRIIKFKRKFPGSCPRLDQAHVIHKGKVYLPKGYLDNRLTKVIIFLELIIFMSFWYAMFISDFSKDNQILFTLISIPLLSVCLFLLYQQFASLLTKYYSRKEKEPRKLAFFYRVHSVDLLKRYLEERETPCYKEYIQCTDYFNN